MALASTVPNRWTEVSSFPSSRPRCSPLPLSSLTFEISSLPLSSSLPLCFAICNLPVCSPMLHPQIVTERGIYPQAMTRPGRGCFRTAGIMLAVRRIFFVPILPKAWASWYGVSPGPVPRLGPRLNSSDRRPHLRQLALERSQARQWGGLFVVFGQAKADDIDPAATEVARHQNDGVERQRRALLRRMIEMNVEIIGQRQLRLLAIHGHAIGRSQVAKRDLAGNDEIPEQMRVGRRARQRVDQNAIQRFALFRRRQQVDVVAGETRIGFSGRKNVLVADHQSRLRPGWNGDAA